MHVLQCSRQQGRRYKRNYSDADMGGKPGRRRLNVVGEMDDVSHHPLGASERRQPRSRRLHAARRSCKQLAPEHRFNVRQRVRYGGLSGLHLSRDFTQGAVLPDGEQQFQMTNF